MSDDEPGDWGYCYDCKHCHEFEEDDGDNVYFSNNCEYCECEYHQYESD